MLKVVFDTNVFLYLVSGDKDLLDLKELKGIKIVSAVEFLKEIKE